MKRIAAALLVALGAATAAAEDTFRAELPLGPVVREGRPVVVRVPGAEYVHLMTPGAPSANATGTRGDEFVIQWADAPGGVLTFLAGTVADGSERVRLNVRVLPASGEVVGRFGDAEGGAIGLPVDGLPTVREAWLLFDRVEGEPPGAEQAVLDALASWRAGARPGTDRAAFAPLTHAPSEDAFRGAALVDRDAPGLPDSVVRLLVVLAAAESVLAVVVFRRPGSARTRAAWLGAPAVAAAVWLLASGSLPGPIRATAFVLEGPEDRLVVVRFEARRFGWPRIDVPGAASWPALLRFSTDDTSATTDTLGRTSLLLMDSGESRLLAYSLPKGEDAREGPGPDVPAPLARWMRGLGLEVTGAGAPIRPEDLPSSDGLVVVPALSLRVAPGK